METFRSRAVPPPMTTSPEPATLMSSGPEADATRAEPEPAMFTSRPFLTAAAATSPEPATRTRRLPEVPMRVSPDPACEIRASPSTFAMVQSPHPALSRVRLPERPTVPKTAPAASTLVSRGVRITTCGMSCQPMLPAPRTSTDELVPELRQLRIRRPRSPSRIVRSPMVRTVSGKDPFGRIIWILMSLRASGITVTRATTSRISTVAL